MQAETRIIWQRRASHEHERTGTAVNQTSSRCCGRRATGTPFFGFGTNILVNMLVLTVCCVFVLKMPDSLVFGRILARARLMMCLSTFYYAWLAYRLAQKDRPHRRLCAAFGVQRAAHVHHLRDHAAGHPQTGGSMKGWSAGLVLGVLPEFYSDDSAAVAPLSARSRPRRAARQLAGVSVTFISMRPALECI